MTWPPSRGLMVSHWPFQFGYFASSAARALLMIVSAAATATATVTVELRSTMAVLPTFRIAFCRLDANGAYHRAGRGRTSHGCASRDAQRGRRARRQRR